MRFWLTGAAFGAAIFAAAFALTYEFAGARAQRARFGIRYAQRRPPACLARQRAGMRAL